MQDYIVSIYPRKYDFPVGWQCFVSAKSRPLRSGSSTELLTSPESSCKHLFFLGLYRIQTFLCAEMEFEMYLGTLFPLRQRKREVLPGAYFLHECALVCMGNAIRCIPEQLDIIS